MTLSSIDLKQLACSFVEYFFPGSESLRKANKWHHLLIRDFGADSIPKGHRDRKEYKRVYLRHQLSIQLFLQRCQDISINPEQITDGIKTCRLLEAERQALLVKDERHKSTALKVISRAYIKIGNLSKALMVASHITDKDMKIEILESVVEAYIKIGNIEEAVIVANQISATYIKNCVLRFLVLAYLKKGEISKAECLFAEISESFFQGNCCSNAIEMLLHKKIEEKEEFKLLQRTLDFIAIKRAAEEHFVLESMKSRDNMVNLIIDDFAKLVFAKYGLKITHVNGAEEKIYNKSICRTSLLNEHFKEEDNLIFMSEGDFKFSHVIYFNPKIRIISSGREIVNIPPEKDCQSFLIEYLGSRFNQYTFISVLSIRKEPVGMNIKT